MEHTSTVIIKSRLHEGISFELLRMSFSRRMDLMIQVRELARKLEFYRAGESDADQMDAHLLNAEIERAYLIWGLLSIRGLRIDGIDATPETLVCAGPEDLVREAIQAIKMECSLTETEAKNS